MARLVGRDEELSLLLELLEHEGSGQAGIVFLTGEAGAGKSRLVDEALARQSRPILRGEASPDTPSPYAPLVEALRGFYRDDQEALAARPLAKYLATLLPELGLAPVDADQPTLNAAISDALAPPGEEGAVLVLEDLHWADAGTLDVLLDLSKLPARSGLSILATYRNDELPRLHRLRGVRSELRRARRLTEVVLEPLNREETYTLTKEAAGTTLPADVLRAVYERSEGIPFFIEELAALARDLPDPRDKAASQAELPETIRDAVRQRTGSLDEEVRDALDVMAVAGPSIPLPLLVELVDADAISRLLEHGWLARSGDGLVWFRHALVRDAVYSDIPWVRRRDLHRSLADALEGQGSSPEIAAHHWIAGNDPLRARPHLLEAARSFCTLHAYRDARALLRQALTDWPANELDEERAAALELLAGCVELSGDHDEAAGIWRDVTKARRALDDVPGVARAQRRLATVLEMQGDWRAAVEARISAAVAFGQCDQAAEAAAERLGAAQHYLQTANQITAALDLAELAAADAESASAMELALRARAVQGQIRSQMGEPYGVEMVREALGAALAGGYTAAASEIYYRLAVALEYSAHYDGAVDAFEQAAAFCKSQGFDEMGKICFACLAPTLRHVGRWKEAIDVCRSILADPDEQIGAWNIAAGELGLIHALKGNTSSARRLLGPARRFARADNLFPLEVETTWGEAIVASLDGNDQEATAIVTSLIDDCRRREEWHYSLSVMRWSVTWFAVRGDSQMLSAAARVLSDAAAATGSQEARAALTFALMEGALAQADAAMAQNHARQTLELLARVSAPLEAAAMRARCALALAGAGERDTALDLLTNSYRVAKKLGARPLARSIVDMFDELGEPVEPHLGRAARAGAERGGLSRRELDVLRHIAAGRTNKEIAELLFLSTRTVDMHVRNVLTKLDCRSRTEAVARATELRLLGAKQPDTA